MGRKPKATVNLDSLIGLAEDEDIEEQSFQDFISEVGPGSSVIEIYRMYPNGRRPYVDTISPDVLKESPLEYLRDTYGPGKMLLRFKGPDRKYRVGGNKVIEVEAKNPNPAPAVAPPPNGASDHVAFLREQMATQQSLLMAMIAGMKGPDIGAMMTGLGTILAAIVTGVPKSDPSAMLNTMVTAFTTLRGPEKDADWEKAGKLIEMAKNLAPESAAPSDMFGVVRDVGKAIVEKIDLSHMGSMSPGSDPRLLPGAVIPATVVPPGHTGHDVTVLPPQPVKTEVKLQPGASMPKLTREQWIGAAVMYLKEKARLNKDPGLFVDLILQSQEEPQWAAIVNAIEQGATFEMLLSFDPEIPNNVQLQDWFKRLYDGLHDELITIGPDGAGTVDPSRTGGDPSNVA